MPPRKVGKRRVGPKKYGKKKMMAKKRYAKTQGQVANVKQTISLISGKLRYNTIYTTYNISLLSSTRATKVAEAYQEYRISKLVFRFKPQQDTYMGPNGSIPYLHYVVDRAGSFQNSNINFRSLRETGCKVIRFDDKTRSVAFSPGVLVANTPNDYSAVAPQFSSYKISPWLNTNKNTLDPGVWNANDVDHSGIVYGIEQDTTAANNTLFDVDIDVYYQFRKPRVMTTGTPPAGGIVQLNMDETGLDIQK